MTTIIIYSENQQEISRITGNKIFVKIIDGIQCICEDTSDAYFDGFKIINTIPKNYFIEVHYDTENQD